MLAWLCVWVKVQNCTWPSWCHCHSLSLAPVNPDWFYLSGASSPGLSQTKYKRAVKRLCVCVCWCCCHFQMKAEFFRMTKINMVECLQKFWTTKRVDIALARLQVDKVARDIVSGVQETNVIGWKFLFVSFFFPNACCLFTGLNFHCMHNQSLQKIAWSHSITFPNLVFLSALQSELYLVS